MLKKAAKKKSQEGEKVQKKGGEGSGSKLKRSTIQNVDYFDMRRGFSCFPQIQMIEIWP